MFFDRIFVFIFLLFFSSPNFKRGGALAPPMDEPPLISNTHISHTHISNIHISHTHTHTSQTHTYLTHTPSSRVLTFTLLSHTVAAVVISVALVPDAARRNDVFFWLPSSPTPTSRSPSLRSWTRSSRTAPSTSGVRSTR